jgi:hypothetical protein
LAVINLAADRNEPIVEVRREWNDYVEGLHWTNFSSVGFCAPRLFVHGFVLCDQMADCELAHSCQHGPFPHRIKVRMTKTGNEAIWSRS